MGGDRDRHPQAETRNLNRIFLIVLSVIFLSALVGVPLYFHYRSNRSVQLPCHEDLSVPISNPVFHPNGSVEDGDNVYPEGFHFTTNGTTRGCLCVLRACIRKCCGKEEHFVKTPHSISKCEKNPGTSLFDNFSYPVHTTPGEPVEVARDHFQILYGDVCRHGRFVLDPEKYPADTHHLLTDGSVIVRENHLDVSTYCLESMNGSDAIRVFVCFGDQRPDDETKLLYLLYPIAMIISMPFLMATILVYSTLPGLWNLHGKSLVCQCSSLLISYLGLTIIQLKGGKIDNTLCVMLGFMVQLAFLGSFFWLNVMSFDIWWSFSGLRPTQWGLKSMEHKKFFLYSLYAWGTPFMIVATSVAMDMVSSIPDSYIKPHMGLERCWFADWQGTTLYFYLPCGIVLVLNTLMFITTAFKIRSCTKNDSDKDRFHLYLRLFLIMGLTWILELLSFFVGGPKSLWFVTDICNIFQGVIIFFLFVCKRDILQKLNKQMCPGWKILQGTSPEYSERLSSSISLNNTCALDTQDNDSEK